MYVSAGSRQKVHGNRLLRSRGGSVGAAVLLLMAGETRAELPVSAADLRLPDDAGLKLPTVSGSTVSAPAYRVSANPETSDKSRPANLGRGSILVLPETGENMPDLATMLVALKRAGYNPPGNQLELIDGREFFGTLVDGPVVIGGRDVVSQSLTGCQQAREKLPANTAEELAALVKQAGNGLVTGEFDVADKALTRADGLVLCLNTPANPDTLYRLYLLQGVLAYQLKRNAQVPVAFEQAILIDPEREWDRAFPPGAWEQFLKVQRRLLDAPKIPVRLQTLNRQAAGEADSSLDGKSAAASAVTAQTSGNTPFASGAGATGQSGVPAGAGATLEAGAAPVSTAGDPAGMGASGPSGVAGVMASTAPAGSSPSGSGSASDILVWLDGQPLVMTPDAPSRAVRKGIHLLQVQSGAASTLQTRWLDLTGEEGNTPVWITSRSQLERWELLFGPEGGGDPARVVLDGLVRKAREGKRDWMLLVQPEAAPRELQVRYVDVKKGVMAEAPAQIKTSGPQVNLPPVAGRPGRSVNVPGFLQGWHVTVGPQILQQVTGEGLRYFGLELGGFRPIQGNISARVAMAIGRVGNNTYSDLHLGVRRSWDMQPFGLFLEGGMLGCKCQGNAGATDTKAVLGLELRGGPTYYFMDPLKENGLDVNLGFGLLFSGELIGGFGINYHRGF